MATTTTNFGWDIPQSTDLVKDGATAIAALGQDIDTALVDLKGGTTGQILAKASNTDLDYTWTSPNPGDITAVTAGTGISGGGTSGDVTITNSMATAIDAKGDLVVGTGADAFSRLAVGSNNQVLTADSTAATGLKWAAAAAGKVIQVVSASYTTETASSSTTYADTGLTATITPTSATSTILVLVNQNGCSKASGNSSSAVAIKTFRGATEIAAMTQMGFTNTSSSLLSLSYAIALVDSPATTSATTYKTQFANNTAAASVSVQNNSARSTIVLIELGA